MRDVNHYPALDMTSVTAPNVGPSTAFVEIVSAALPSIQGPLGPNWTPADIAAVRAGWLSGPA